MDKFHDFLSLFVFYKIFKQLYDKFTAMLSGHGARSFWSAPEIGRKSTSYRKQFSNCLKMVHVGLYSVGTYHKNFGWENKKK
jgi:hypothetical protein